MAVLYNIDWDTVTELYKGTTALDALYAGTTCIWSSVPHVTLASLIAKVYPIRVDVTDTNTQTGDVTIYNGYNGSTSVIPNQKFTSVDQVKKFTEIVAAYTDGSTSVVTNDCDFNFDARSDNTVLTTVTLPGYSSGINTTFITTITGMNICLAGDTLITMCDRTTKRLDQLAAGDCVLTSQGVAKVLDIRSGHISSFHTLYTFDDGTVIDETGTHRFYNVEQGFWQHLGAWNIGEHARKIDGSTTALVNVQRIDEQIEQFGLWVESHDYYANGLLSGDAQANNRLLSEADAKLAAAMLASIKPEDLEEVNEWSELFE